MEVKCDICGTINDGNTTFCKGCFQKLDAERKENKEINDIPTVISTIELEKPVEIPWNSDDYQIGDEKQESTEINQNNEKSSSLEDAFSVMPDGNINEESKEENKSTEESKVSDFTFEFEPIAGPTLEEEKEPKEENKSTEESKVSDFTFEFEPIAGPILEEEKEIKEENKSTEESKVSDFTFEFEPIAGPILEEEKEIKEENKSTEESKVSDFTFEFEPIAGPTLEEEKIDEIDKKESSDIEIADNSIASLTLDDIESLNRDNEPAAKVVEDGIDNLVEQFHEGINPKKKKHEETNDSIVKKYIISFLIKYAILFVAVFGVLIIISKILPNFINGDTVIIIEFALNRLAGLLTLVFAAKLTFKKEVPEIGKLNNVSFKILLFIALPFMLLQMFVLGFIKNTTVLMFIIGVILVVITLAIFFNYMRNIIRRRNEDKSEDKTFFRYGIISIVIVVVLLFTGMFLRSKNLVMPKINLFYKVLENTNADIDIITNFVKNVQDTMYANVLAGAEKGEEYKVPVTITDVALASYEEYKPDSIVLNLSENGTVTNGKIVYRGVTYNYDGKNIKAE